MLQERTEGWVAGLRLAAISLAGHSDPERFVREFCGSERTVAGYLLAEVLEPPAGRGPRSAAPHLDSRPGERTAGRLPHGLIRVRAGSAGPRGRQSLRHLARRGAVVVPLPPPVRRLLRLELRRTDPASIGPLHRKAASWHEEHGYPVEAIRHAQRAEDWQHAARLLADTYLALLIDGRIPAVRDLLGAFPPEASARGRGAGTRLRRDTDHRSGPRGGARATSISPGNWPRPSPTSAGHALTFTWPCSRLRSRGGAAI